MNWAAITWLLLTVVFLMLEGATVTLVSIWFAIGSVAAMIVSLFGGSLLMQLTVCILVSGLMLLLLRPLVRRFINPKITPTNVDSVIGSTGLVTIAIDNSVPAGQVRLGAMEWTARSSSGEPIPPHTLIRVDRIEGVKVFVSPTE